MNSRNSNAIGRRADIYADWIGAEAGFIVGETWGRPAPRRAKPSIFTRLARALRAAVIAFTGR
jgi:hypothetical protein